MEEIAMVRLKLSWFWKVVIVCFALAVATLTALLIPPLPTFSLASANSDLTVGLVVTNSAAAPITYRNITAVAFLAGEEEEEAGGGGGDRPLSAVSAALTPFRQSAGEVSRVMFQLRYDEEAAAYDESRRRRSAAVHSVVMRARASYGGAAWPWKEIDVTAVCEGGRKKCEVEGLWIWREMVMFVAVFVFPFFLYVFLLYYQNFLVCE